MLTKEEFFEKFPFALAFYDHYKAEKKSVRSDELYAKAALMKAGIVSTRSENYLANELISIWERGVSRELMNIAIEPLWNYYHRHG